MKNLHIFSTIPALLLVLILGLFSSPLFAVDNIGVFELDGNADQDASPEPPDDWETLDSGGGSATAYTRIVDKNGSDDIFTGGGSKTPNDVADWDWKSNPPPPDKNNIVNAFAANYIHAGSQYIFFGADLFADNGDAELAFWFFQSLVEQNGTTMGAFDGNHVDGDVYVAVKFANGGTLANIAVYEWWEACNKAVQNPGVGDCAADNIRVVVAQGPALCTGGGGVACAITNTANETAHWAYTPKDGVSGIYPPTTFFEGGINIPALFGSNKCFASFMASTGASTSFTATAKDFALDDFDVCSVDVSKTCANDSEADDAPGAIVYDVRGCGINSGSGDINLTTLENSIAGGPSDYTPADLAWYVPGQVDDGGGLRDFDPATDCDDETLLAQAIASGTVVTDLSSEDVGAGEALVYEFSETTDMNGATDTVTLDAVGTDGAPIDAADDTATCPLREFSASMEVTKQCAADLEVLAGEGEDQDLLVVKIVVAGMVCNTGEVQLTNLSLTDSVASGEVSLTPDSTTLEPAGDAAGEDCTDYTGYYYPTVIPGQDICPFADMVTATANAPTNTATGGETGCTVVAGPAIECSADSNTATCNLRATDGDADCSTGPLDPTP